VVDVTKGAALMLAEGENLDRFLASAAAPAVFAHPSPRLPHIALPTTLSGAEYSPYAGITDEAAREKHVYFDKGLAPRWVVATNPRPVENPTALVEVLENAW
jgi:maleylacetate reductase